MSTCMCTLTKCNFSRTMLHEQCGVTSGVTNAHKLHCQVWTVPGSCHSWSEQLCHTEIALNVPLSNWIILEKWAFTDFHKIIQCWICIFFWSNPDTSRCHGSCASRSGLASTPKCLCMGLPVLCGFQCLKSPKNELSPIFTGFLHLHLKFRCNFKSEIGFS